MPIVLFALTLLVILHRVSRALEPQCPNCGSKHWIDHSTQLECMGCGWSSSATPAATATVATVVSTEPGQYELCLN